MPEPKATDERAERLKQIRERLKNIENFFKQHPWHHSVYYCIFYSNPEKTAVKKMVDNAPKDVEFLLEEISRLEKEISKTTKKEVKNAGNDQ